MADPVLEVENLSVRRDGGALALRNIDFVAARKSTLGVLGANGAGKSTLLDTLSGFLRPEFWDHSLPGRKDRRQGAA